ncbi:MAG: hypothetical protein PHH00_00680 [Candidatus Nanoarchaeia archaeon]|nr:hypothetical protein [Candidatus Nanoarchaeia archaeon]
MRLGDFNLGDWISRVTAGKRDRQVYFERLGEKVTQTLTALTNSDKTRRLKDSELCWVNRYATPGNRFEDGLTFEKALTYPELREDPAFSKLAKFSQLFPPNFCYPQILADVGRAAVRIITRTMSEEEYYSIIDSTHAIFQDMRDWFKIVVPEWEKEGSMPFYSFMRGMTEPLQTK